MATLNSAFGEKKKKEEEGNFFLFLFISLSLSLFFFVSTRRKTGYRLSAFIGQLDRTTNFIGSEVSVSFFLFFSFRNCFFPRCFTSFLFLSINIYKGEIAILILNPEYIFPNFFFIKISFESCTINVSFYFNNNNNNTTIRHLSLDVRASRSNEEEKKQNKQTTKFVLRRQKTDHYFSRPFTPLRR